MPSFILFSTNKQLPFFACLNLRLNFKINVVNFLSELGTHAVQFKLLLLIHFRVSGNKGTTWNAASKLVIGDFFFFLEEDDESP